MEITSKRKRPGELFTRTAIAAVVASSFSSGAAFAQEENQEEATKLDTIEVTGSRLTRAAVEGALPVSVIDREDIETSGFTSVGELLRNTVFNSTGAFRAQSGSSAQSLVSVDLRGLGSERTLVLIDGRRAPKAPFAPTDQDLNAVPIAAVERIEILKDGASAIYGSDAIGGVINIITRKDFQGVEISHQLQGTDRKGGDVEQGSVT
ncbi:MAG: TonB-dependent receptor plug domain-containing protein, partial [Pseudomonadota bacterium]